MYSAVTIAQIEWELEHAEPYLQQIPEVWDELRQTNEFYVRKGLSTEEWFAVKVTFFLLILEAHYSEVLQC